MPIVGADFDKYVASFGYKVLGVYVNNSTKIEFKCDKGHVCKTTPKSFKGDSRCPKCTNTCPEQAKDNFLKLFKDKDYKLLGIYTGVMNSVEMECNLGHKFKRRPNDTTNGYGCKICAHIKK